VSYSTVLVHMAPGQLNTSLLKVAATLADRFDSDVIGLAACQPMMANYGEGYTSADMFQADRDAIDKDLADAERQFRDAFQTRAARCEWRSSVTYGPLADYVASQARRADLIVINPMASALFSGSRHAHTGDLIMQAGRPLLLVPETANLLRVDRILIAWKDTRESRRAAVDALPLLKAASHVTIAEIASEKTLAAARGRIEDVAVWLKSHGVTGKPFVAQSSGDDAGQLRVIAQEQGADILVAGAYGHNRLREWAFGGVSRELLLRPDCCSLVSH